MNQFNDTLFGLLANVKDDDELRAYVRGMSSIEWKLYVRLVTLEYDLRVARRRNEEANKRLRFGFLFLAGWVVVEFLWRVL